MKKSLLTPIKRAICILLIAFALPKTLYSQWVNGQAADLAFGQNSLSGTSQGNGLSQLFVPTSIVVSTVTGKVFIADYGNNRILRFGNHVSYTNGDAAELAITTISGTTFRPYGLYIDASDRLWISDSNNNRVLRVSNASTLTNAVADIVLGQPNINGTGSGTGLNQMSNPSSVFVDEVHQMVWVTDSYNHRLLRFDNANALTNGASASVVIGNALGGVTSNEFSSPGQNYVDKNGTLWIADTGNNRVLRFSGAHTLVSNANADLVLGQTNFTSGTSQTASQTSLNQPVGVYGDNGGRLYVSCNGHSRVLVFEDAAQLTTNAPASFVIGKADFTGGSAASASARLNNPYQVFVDNYLWVADFTNNRALRFSPINTLPVSLSSFTVESKTSGKIIVQWETASEINNSHFIIESSMDGKNFTRVDRIETKAPNGSSTDLIKYSYIIDLTIPITTAFAGLGLFSLLLLPVFRNRTQKVLMAIFLAGVLISCSKQEITEEMEEKTIYIRLSQIDKNGQVTVFDIKSVKVETQK